MTSGMPAGALAARVPPLPCATAVIGPRTQCQHNTQLQAAAARSLIYLRPYRDTASKRRSAARIAANLRISLFERFPVFAHSPLNCISSHRQSIDTFPDSMGHWPKQGIVRWPAAGSSRANWPMGKRENPKFAIGPVHNDHFIDDRLRAVFVTRERRSRCSSQRPTANALTFYSRGKVTSECISFHLLRVALD